MSLLPPPEVDPIRPDELHALQRDVDLQSFVLRPLQKDLPKIDVRESVLDGTITRTIEGASDLQVTVHDFNLDILHSKILTNGVTRRGRLIPFDVKLDGLWFRLTKVTKDGLDLTLTFEDREVSWLRGKKGPRKMARKKVTRAEFILVLLRSIKHHRIRFHSPEIHKKQPLASATQQDARNIRDQRREPGFPDGIDLSGKEGKLEKHQLRNADRALSVAASEKAPLLAVEALVEACLVEAPDFKNPTGGDGTSVGILQLTSIHGSVKHRRDIERVVRQFLRGPAFTGGRDGAIALARKHKGWSAGKIAQTIQGSAHPERYDAVRGKARRIIQAWSGDASGVVSSATRRKPYEFKVKKGESYWAAILRLAQEVQWRAFMVAGTLYYISEDDLFRSRPRFRFSQDTLGIDNIDFEIDRRKRAGTATVTARVDRWKAPPGTIVDIFDMGACNGKWLVSEISRSLFSPEATITLKQPMKPLGEPLGEEVAASGDGGTTVNLSIPEGQNAVKAVWDRTVAIHKKHYPYVWGGGHARAGSPSGGGYDCSGGVASSLEAGGLVPSSWMHGVPASGTMASSYGHAGEGKYITIWANSSHVWMELKINGRRIHCGTGDWGKGWRGYGVNTRMHPKGGFTPRHPPGL